MHPRWLAMAGVLVVTSAAGCAYGIKATSDHNPQVDFSTYGTFFILKGNSSGDSLIDARLDTDVANALFAKGWVEVPQGMTQRSPGCSRPRKARTAPRRISPPQHTASADRRSSFRHHTSSRSRRIENSTC